MGARVLEELRPGHQGGVLDVGARDLPDPGGAGDVAERPKVVGHVPHGGDPAVEVLAHLRLGEAAVRRRGQVLVGVDQPRQEIEASGVDRLGALRCGEVGPHLHDPLALDQDGDAPAERSPGPVDQVGVAVEGDRLRRRQALGGGCEGAICCEDDA